MVEIFLQIQTTQLRQIMTRKRKQIENVQQAGTSIPVFSHHADAIYSSQYLSSRAGYGPAKDKASNDYDGSGFNGYGASKRRKKAFRNDRSENNDFKSEFERKYGYENKHMHKTSRKDEKFVTYIKLILVSNRIVYLITRFRRCLFLRIIWPIPY